MEIGYIIDQRYLSDIAPCEQKPDLGHRANRVINRESYFAYCDSKLRSPLYLGSTEKVEIGEYMQGNYNIYAKKPCRIRKCAPIRYFNDADHSLVMQYIHAGSTCVAPQNRHFCV